MGDIGVDPRWDVLKDFQEYLEEVFPLVYDTVNHIRCLDSSEQIFRHSTLHLTKVNTYGLVYEWKGSSPLMKPILLAAHQGSSDRVQKWRTVICLMLFLKMSYLSKRELLMNGRILPFLDILMVTCCTWPLGIKHTYPYSFRNKTLGQGKLR